MINRYLVVIITSIVVCVFAPLSTNAAEKENLYIEQGEEVKLFHPVNLAPSRMMEKKVVTITNKNETPVEIKTAIKFYLEKEGLDSLRLEKMLDFYEMSAEIHFQGKLHMMEWTSLSQVNEKIHELQLNKMPSKESLEIIYSIRLLEAAHNDFQAVTLHGELVVESMTDKSKIETIVKDKENTKGNSLPNTATETWKYLYVGILLSIGGAALLIYFSIRGAQRKRGNVYGR